jgi:hypothetical protein
MLSTEALLADLVLILSAVALVGLIHRGRARLCRWFAVYLGAVITANRLFAWWPGTFYTRTIWTMNEALAAFLVFCIALELAAMIFHRQMTGAAPTVRRVFLAVLTVTAVLVFWMPDGFSSDYYVVINQLQPRVAVGACWLFGVIAGLSYWFRLPLHEYHRDLLNGFAAYSVAFGVLMSAIGRFGPEADSALRLAYQAATVVVTAYWMRAAWRPEEVPQVSPAVVRELQPWRA